MRGPLEFEEEFEEQWKDWGKKFSKFGKLGTSSIILVALVVIVGFWLASGVYTVSPSQVGLVKQFGQYIATTNSGFHYHLPSPIQSVVIVDTQSLRTLEIGFRSQAGVPSTRFPSNDDEALMLTGDQNIIRAETVIQFNISNPAPFAFEVEDYGEVLQEAAQAVIREVVATHTANEALTGQKELIASEIKVELQGLLDFYEVGIHIANVRLQEVTPPTADVTRAFDDVNSAIQDKEKTIFDAQRYANEQLPLAEGEKQQLINNAEGYKQSRILQAEGEVARFLAVLERYRLGEEVTEARLYIEAMEEILPGLKKIIVPAQGNGLLSLLNLDELLKGDSQ
jgi:membrane protease subunit HflK